MSEITNSTISMINIVKKLTLDLLICFKKAIGSFVFCFDMLGIVN
jgi:hypothetical protein